MKDFRGMKRQRSRSNRKPAGNSNNPNRAYESNGPEGTKVRGNAQTIYEKYQQLARDANSSGDRVLAENHLQHAEHYFRMIRQMQPTRPVSEFVQRDPFSSGFDDDYDDVEVEATEPDADAAQSDDQPSQDEPRYENRERNDRGNRNDRNDRQNNDRNRDRDRNFKDRGDRNNGDRNNGEQRSFEPRNNNGNRDNSQRDNGGDRNEPQFDENGNRRETRRERYERRRQQRFAEQEQNLNAPMSVSAPAAEYTAPAFIASTQPLGAQPRTPQPDLGFDAPAVEAPVIKEKRERPERPERPERKERVSSSSDASQLPAFMHRPTPVAAEPAAAAPEAEAKPKRTRKKKEDAAASEEA